MTTIVNAGYVTSTDQRDLKVAAETCHVRLDLAGDTAWLTVPAANRLCNLLIKAMNTAISQGADIA